MSIDIGTKMVRRRISETEEADDARILAARKARREELLAEAQATPKPRRHFVATWFRGLRTIRTV